MTKSATDKSPRGEVSVNFKVDQRELEAAKQKALKNAAPEVTLPGFRKGKAPLAQIRAKLGEETLTQKALEELLPVKVTAAIRAKKIRPAVMPKVEVVSAKPGEDWEFKATTCEIPEVALGSYKTAVKKALSLSAKKEKNEQEQAVIMALLGAVKVDLPVMLLEEEITARLSQLLSRLERLGISYENYLTSIKRTNEELRKEYQKQAEDSLKLELALSKVAEVEKVKVSKEAIEEAVSASGNVDRHYVESVLLRRQALERLMKLV